MFVVNGRQFFFVQRFINEFGGIYSWAGNCKFGPSTEETNTYNFLSSNKRDPRPTTHDPRSTHPRPTYPRDLASPSFLLCSNFERFCPKSSENGKGVRSPPPPTPNSPLIPNLLINSCLIYTKWRNELKIFRLEPS